MGKTMSSSGDASGKEKPRIAITGEEVVEPMGGSPVFVLSRRYGAAVARAGGLPLMPGDVRLAGDYAEIADGLILTHGPAIHRGRYGKYYLSFEEMRGLSISRDGFEFSLFREFHRRNKPVLGIGRGMDIINIALGGIPGEAAPEKLGGALKPWVLKPGAPEGIVLPGAPVFGVPWRPEWEDLILNDILSWFVGEQFSCLTAPGKRSLP
jgi:hypothetical protein